MREELLVVQQADEDRPDHGVIDDRQKELSALVLPVWAGANVMTAEQAALVFAKTIAKSRRAAEQTAIDDFGGEQRNESHHRVDVDVAPGAVRPDDQVFEKPGLRVPQRRSTGRVARERVANAKKLLIGLDRDVFVIRIGLGQFKRDHGHVEREHRHPTGGVGLLERVAERQRLGAVE